MANPRSKWSNTRTNKRRTHYKATAATIMSCTNCGTPVQYHRVCPECGHYKGKLAVEKTTTA